jgi:hypothetical protein
VHEAAVFCARELPVENYGKDLANSNWSTPLSESRARNLIPPVFVVWQQYGDDDFTSSVSLVQIAYGLTDLMQRARLVHDW